jgi:IS1 family transposase
LYSEAWRACAASLAAARHRVASKSSGQTAPVERWYNTLRQRVARYVRKTLWFSKPEEEHYWLTLWHLLDDNLQVASLTT